MHTGVNINCVASLSFFFPHPPEDKNNNNNYLTCSSIYPDELRHLRGRHETAKAAVAIVRVVRLDELVYLIDIGRLEVWTINSHC